MGVIDLDAPASFGRYRSLHISRGEYQSLQPSEGYHAGARAHNAAGFGGGGYGSGRPNPRAISHLSRGWPPHSRWKAAGTKPCWPPSAKPVT